MTNDKKSLIALKKARTSLNKVIKMQEDGSYCIDILQQLLAIKGLINSSSNQIMQNHLKHCFSQGLKTNDKKTEEKLIKELVQVINLNERTK